MAEYKKDKENEIADGQSHFFINDLQIYDLTMYDLFTIYLFGNLFFLGQVNN
jgi:hypothetical protein